MLGTRPVICTASTAKLYPAKKKEKKHHLELVLTHFCYTPKKLRLCKFDMLLVSVHFSSLQVARGCDVPLNSHYDLRNNLQQMGGQMKTQCILS